MRSRVSSAGFDDPAVAGRVVDDRDGLGSQGDVDGAVVGLVGAGFADDGDVGRRLRVPQDRGGLGLVLPGVDEERPGRVDDPAAPVLALVADVFGFSEGADDEHAVRAVARREQRVVGRALVVALFEGVRRVVEFGGEDAAGDFAGEF